MFSAIAGGSYILPAIHGSRQPGHISAARTTILDLSSLDSTVHRLFKAGLAASTQKVYGTGSRQYINYCDLYAVSNPFPVAENTLIHFASYLYTERVKAGTIKSYLVAVKHAQISLGLGDPKMCDMPQLEYVIKGIKRCTGQQSRTRFPITPGLMRNLRCYWRSNHTERDYIMLWAVACMCFFGFMRTGELVVPSDSGFDPSCHLAAGDVFVNNRSSPSYLVVNVKVSKTNPFRQGVQIHLGRMSSELCPVAAILSYMVKRGTSDGPFFRFEDGRYLTRDRFVTVVCSALVAAGVNPSHYAGHSFRIGAATNAASCSLQDSLIKTLGRWESSVYALYIRTPKETLCAVSRSLAGARSR